MGLPFVQGVEPKYLESFVECMSNNESRVPDGIELRWG